MAASNIAASVKQRLLNLARKRGVELNRLLTWYGIERLLFRLSCSRHEERFVLKGAMLFHIWREQPHRPTRDLDLLGRGSPDEAALAAIFCELCATKVEDDGVDFAADSVRAEPIREGKSYLGIRIKLLGRLGAARIPLQVDIGFGDSIVPAPETVELPTLLGHVAPRLKTYRRETVIAEKLHAIVDLGLTNTRMKDYFDLWFLAASFSFEAATLAEAIAATFNRRATLLPESLPPGLTAAFADDGLKQSQWRGFLGRSGLSEGLQLSRVVTEIGGFLALPLQGARGGGTPAMNWQPGGPWRDEARIPPEGSVAIARTFK
jgi:predicted nucleotidyltransferase component of viral defense system